MNKATSAYLQAGVNTTSPGQLLIMLYEAAIKFLRQAQERIQAKDVAKKGILISKALDILTELTATLNLEKGGDLADNLQKLYFYCTTKLLAANLKQDVVLIEEVIGILDGLRDAYQTLLNQGVSGQEGRSPQSSAGLVRGFAAPARPAQSARPDDGQLQSQAQMLAFTAKPGAVPPARPGQPQAGTPAPGAQPVRPPMPGVQPGGMHARPAVSPQPTRPVAPVQPGAPAPQPVFGAQKAPAAPVASTAVLAEAGNQTPPSAPPSGAAPQPGGLGRAFSSYAKSAKQPPRA